MVNEEDAVRNRYLILQSQKSHPAAVARMAKEAEALFGAFDISVSNVAIRHKQPFLDISGISHCNSH